MKGYANAALLTTPAELAAAIEAGRPPLIIDLRPPEDFAAGHIAGAVHLDLWGVSLIDTDPAPLKAFMWMIDHLFNLRGVTAETPVVVYDEQSGLRAARAFWFLEYFGHPAVQLLDGGFNAWVDGKFPVTRESKGRRRAPGPARRRRAPSRPGATSRHASATPTSSCWTRGRMASGTEPRCVRNVAAAFPARCTSSGRATLARTAR